MGERCVWNRRVLDEKWVKHRTDDEWDSLSAIVKVWGVNGKLHHPSLQV